MEIRDVGSIANFATAQKTDDTNVNDKVAVEVLKKANEVQASSAAALIEALPPATPANNLPPHLGKNINTTA
jgi:hypothetical protein